DAVEPAARRSDPPPSLDESALPEATTPVAATPRPGLWSPHTLRPVGIFLASRTVVALALALTTRVRHQPFLGLLTSWDSRWYLSIAKSGYASKIPPGTGNQAQSNLGFFPLLPLVIRGVHEVTRLDYVHAGVLATFLVGLFASVALWWLLADQFSFDAADRGTALVLFWPAAFVLSYVYTEGLVILLVASTLLALRRRRWVLAGVCAAIGSTADPVATAIVVPCIVACVLAVRTRGEWRSLAAPLLASLGILSFFTYLWAHAGSPFEWFHAQRRGWQGGVYGTGVPKAVTSFVLHGVTNLNPPVKVASALVAVAMVVVFARARPPATWRAYVYTVLGYGVLSPIIGITPRILLRDFPLVGVVATRIPRRWFPVVLVVSGALMVALLLAASTPWFTP
ncbi:MAG TPA: hypothetical protein VIE15_03895, partial [Acidimicrobiales bacterium]